MLGKQVSRVPLSGNFTKVDLAPGAGVLYPKMAYSDVPKLAVALSVGDSQRRGAIYKD